MKKYFAFLFIFLLLIPLVRADCGITNLADCITQSFFNFLLSILNAPIQPLLDIVHNLLTQPVNTDIFLEVWGVIVYILSMFYGILLMYVGLKFILSGYSPEEREKAKSMLANILIMIVLVQASYYLYSLVIQIASSVSTVTLNMIDSNFFLLTIDNITNVGLELAFLIPYLASIVVTLIILVLRYLIVSVGVILFPVGIFLYFIEPLQHYGKLIVNFLIATISLTFFYSIVFLASSKLIEIDTFQNIKILVMIGAFTFVNIATLFLALFIVVKSALKIATPIMKVVSAVGAVTGA